MHKITDLWKFDLNWSSKLQDNNGRKNTIVVQSCVLSDAGFRDLKMQFSGLEIKFKHMYIGGKWLLSQKLHYFRRSRFVTMYYQQLSIACYQVSFYANNYFEHQ